MRQKKILLTNFSRCAQAQSWCLRPETEQHLLHYLNTEPNKTLLTRGAGLSYSDCNLNEQGVIIDTKHLNHFISFDKHTGVVVCQAGITFLELLNLDKEFIPPVLPGTLHATVAGGIANDVHGKNHHREHSLGHHLLWMDILIANQVIHCSRERNCELFYATIGGLGLTGTILRLAIRLKKARNGVHAINKRVESLSSLIDEMASNGLQNDYQVAWLDLLSPQPRAILSLGNHSYNDILNTYPTNYYMLPKLPFKLIGRWNMRLFNSYFYQYKKSEETLTLAQFNNPLDTVRHWNYLYGAKGLLQFQAVFPQETALSTIEHLMQLIKVHKATPTLAVLKLLTQTSEGLLSFCRPGFTLAIDFPNTTNAHEAIMAMNQLITKIQGAVYLAKDMLLKPEQFQIMYPQYKQFKKIVNQYKPKMESNLSKRLRITL
jgi:FAD/FMN-containing dehydrogenase